MSLQTTFMASLLSFSSMFVAACPDSSVQVGGIAGSNGDISCEVTGGSATIAGGVVSAQGGTAKATPKGKTKIKSAKVVVFHDTNKNGRPDEGEAVVQQGQLGGDGTHEFAFGNIGFNIADGAPTVFFCGEIEVNGECKPFGPFSQNMGNMISTRD